MQVRVKAGAPKHLNSRITPTGAAAKSAALKAKRAGAAPAPTKLAHSKASLMRPTAGRVVKVAKSAPKVLLAKRIVNKARGRASVPQLVQVRVSLACKAALVLLANACLPAEPARLLRLPLQQSAGHAMLWQSLPSCVQPFVCGPSVPSVDKRIQHGMGHLMGFHIRMGVWLSTCAFG